MLAETVRPTLPLTQHRSRLLLVDDHHLVLDSLKQLLSDEYEVQTVDTDKAFLDELDRFDPDVAILGMMHSADIFAIVKRALKIKPALKVVFLSMHSESAGPHLAAKAGAKAYVSKTASLGDLRSIIRAVLTGDDLLTEIRKKPALSSGTQSILTMRQREVLRLIAKGCSAKDVANALKVGVRTAEFHRAAIMDRLKIRTTAELTRYAIANDIT